MSDSQEKVNSNFPSLRIKNPSEINQNDIQNETLDSPRTVDHTNHEVDADFNAPKLKRPSTYDNGADAEFKRYKFNDNEQAEDNKEVDPSNEASTSTGADFKHCNLNENKQQAEDNNEAAISTNNEADVSLNNLADASIEAFSVTPEPQEADSNVDDESKPTSTATEDIKPALVVKAEASSSTRVSCRFGIRCYRRNPVHRAEEAHPGDTDYKRPSYPNPPLGTPACPFGNACYRRNPVHFQQYSHPADI